jgi:predicted permease
MNFLDLLIGMMPVVIYALIGYSCSQYFEVKLKSLVVFAIYFLIPIVSFHGAYTSEINLDFLILFLVFFLLPSILVIFFLFISSFFLKDTTKNIWAVSVTLGNFGYFGLPVGISVLGENATNELIIAGFGFSIFSATVGYFVLANKKGEWKKSIKKVLSLPTLYAFSLGIFINLSGFDISDTKLYKDISRDFISCFSIIGMMILGASISEYKINWKFKFLSLTFLAKDLVWILVIISLIFLDNNFFKIVEDVLVYKIMLLFSLLPMGANTISYAILLNYDKEIISKVSTFLIFSSIISIFLIPIVFSFIKF